MSLCNNGLSSDQYFLVNFIMSNYLGPDVYSDNPRCSVSQRLTKGLPPYTSKHIGSSSLTVKQLHCLYYYVLRNADASLLIRPDMVYMYLKGYLPLEPIGKFPQFTDFFPTKLHPQKRYSPTHEIVKGIVVIDDPTVAFISKEELQRFRCLSGLNDLKIDRVVSLSPRRVQPNETQGTNGLVTNQEIRETCKSKKEEEAIAGHAVCLRSKTSEFQETEQECSRNGEVTCNGLVSEKDCNLSAELQETCKRNKEAEAIASHATCISNKTPELQGMEQDCSTNREATINGVVSEQDRNSSAELQEICKRKKEAESIATHATCVSNKTPESQGMKDCSTNGEATFSGLVSDQDCNLSAELQETCKRKKEAEESVVGNAVSGISKTPERFKETYKRKRFKNLSTKATNKNGESPTERDKTEKSTSIVVLPDTNEFDAEPSVVSTGTASKRTLGGPSIGVVDIGVNKVAYFFQVALPGVRKDYGEFSCEIESDGKVILEGSITTGEEKIKRHSRVFEMNIRKLSPPGPFKLCFSLPGPVDPRLVSPNFRSDGIFEAVIIRHNNSN